jgi:hypothetical protein
MKKKIGFFSYGLPDPTQGGSGIFNYLILKYLISKNFNIDAYFIVEDWFTKKHINYYFYNNIKKKINKIYLIKVKNKKNIFDFGKTFFKKIVNYNLTKKIISNKKINYDVHISMGIGWALALKNFKNNLLFLGDPYQSTVIYGQDKKFSLKFIFTFLRALSLNKFFLNKFIKKNINLKSHIGSFSNLSTLYYQNLGITNCKTFSWFSPYVPILKINRKNNSKINILHLGDLGTTASRKNLFSLNKILNKLPNLEDKISIKFIGRSDYKYLDNLNKKVFIFLGYKKNITPYLKDILFAINPSNYPVGTRTRVLTAMSYGIPCLSHISASFNLQKLKHGDGIWFYKDFNDLEIMIDSIVKNPNLIYKLSLKARKSWKKYYNPRVNIPKILRIINL